MSQDIANEFNAAALGASAEFDSASSENQGNSDSKIDWPGRYRVKLKSVRKKDGSQNWPGLSQDSSGRWIYKVIFAQVDSHPLSPKGSSAFDDIYIIAAPDATDEKKFNTAKFSKPKIAALSGNRDFKLANLQAEGCDVYGPDGKISVHHKFTSEYMIDVSIRLTEEGKQVTHVDAIEAAKDGDVTFVQPRPSIAAPTQTAAPAYSALEPGDANAGRAAIDNEVPF